MKQPIDYGPGASLEVQRKFLREFLPPLRAILIATPFVALGIWALFAPH